MRRAVLDNPNVCILEDGSISGSILYHLALEFPDDVANSAVFHLFGIELREHCMRGVAMLIADNARDPSVLALLLHEFRSEFDIRLRVASNKNTSPDDLRTLGNGDADSDWQVLQMVAENPNTPEDVLRILGTKAGMHSYRIRMSVASNKRTPQDILKILGSNASEPSDDVRFYVAMNHNAPTKTLESLADETSEPNRDVRREAAKTLRKRGLR